MSKLNLIPIVTAGTPEKKKLIEHLPKMNGKKVLILGDVGLDEYIMGEVRRISPEAPVPVLDVESSDLRLGLAANVAQNVASLGGDPILVSIIGRDEGGELLKGLFKKSKVKTDYLVEDDSRPTTRKTRIMAQHHHLVRVDREIRKFLSADVEEKVFQKVDSLLPQVEAIVIEDYAKGVISKTLLKRVIEAAHKKGKKVFVDPHQTNSGDFYSGIDLIKPNFNESVALSGLDYDELRDDPEKILDLGKAVQKRTGALQVVMTRGKDGMIIFSGNEVTQVPTYAREVFDVTGAGDTVIAAMSLGLISGLTLVESCMLANFAAGVVVGQVGCVPCHTDELIKYIQSRP